MTALRIGVLAYPGCFASEVFGVPDLLTMAQHLAGPARGHSYDVSILSPRRHVLASGGTRIGVVPPGPVSATGPIDLLVVPGFEVSTAHGLDAVLSGYRAETDLIRACSAAGIAVVSICVGAFLLGGAGVLDGRRATTSWLFADRLAERCPRVDVRADQLVVTDRGVTTTAAFSAMYDFTLGLIGTHNGRDVARATARITLVDDARSSQTPYVDAALLPATGKEFAHRVTRWLDQHLTEPFELATVAAAVHVSTRTLLRRFGDEAGTTPLGYLQQARMRRARYLLESTERTVASIAGEVGYRDSGAFSSVFARVVGQRPRDYRATFRGARAVDRVIA